MSERPSPLLFDLDGTLADTIGDIAASTNHVRDCFGLPPLATEAVQQMVGHGAGTLLQRAMAELGLPVDDPQRQAIRSRYFDHHEQQCVVHARLYDGVVRHLERWRGEGHPMAVVTNKPHQFALRIVRHLGLDDLLPVVIGGDSLPTRKPDPAPLRSALSRLDWPEAGPGTMIGDGETDIVAGQKAGLRTIACLYGYRPAEGLRAAGPDACWQRFGG